ncbi:MAG: Cys-tRNA(Pro) deacylase [Desulfuromonadales bacterium]|nr:Cys-tRNA(Pro) deacylase [Desulfuromonadales bacterium]
MAKDKIPVTSATRLLKQARIDFTPHLYTYEERGGTNVSARELGVDEHHVIKTLIMEDEQHQPLIVLMHGDLEVSTKELARIIGVKNISPCSPDTALKHTGYQVGGTSPLGTRKEMPVYMEATIAALPFIYLNGGKRGFLIRVTPQVVIDLLKPLMVKVGIKTR